MPADRRASRSTEIPERRHWLHPDPEVRPSPIAGLGVFAWASISPSTVVARVDGQLVGQLTHYSNHCCDPNLWWITLTRWRPGVLSQPVPKSPVITARAPVRLISPCPACAGQRCASGRSPAMTGAVMTCVPDTRITG